LPFGTKKGLAVLGSLVGYIIGFFVEKNYEERECNQCGFVGKGRDWNEGHCPGCGSSSYTVKG
jgi:Zn finger protein HypA/HybF involved in hydrogenase expression